MIGRNVPVKINIQGKRSKQAAFITPFISMSFDRFGIKTKA